MPGWACRNCGDAYFSEPPSTGLCIACESSPFIGGQIGSGKSGALNLMIACQQHDDAQQREGSTP